MNKTELISALSEEAAFSKKDIARILEAMKIIFVRELKNNRKIQLAGLGTLQVAQRAARRGINPITKEPLFLAASATARFKAGKHLKEQLRAAMAK